MKRPKVWVVSPELHGHGGTERALLEHVRALAARFDVRVYTTRAESTDPSIAVRNVPAIPWPHLGRYTSWLLSNMLVRGWDAVREGAPDLVLSPGVNCFDADVVGVHMVFAKYWEAVREHIGDGAGWLRVSHRKLYVRLARGLERRVYEKGPALLWAMSAPDARELEDRFGRPEGTVEVIPHGVDGRAFSPAVRRNRRSDARKLVALSDDQRVVLVIANDEVKKGVDTAVAALADLPDDVTLAVAGRVDPGRVMAWARPRGVESRVRVWAHSEDVLDYYSAADLLAAPSREDSFNMPVLEAMACGLPVIVSRAAGVSELIEDGENAVVLEHSEAAPELAAAIGKLLADPVAAGRVGASGRALAEHHSWHDGARRVVEQINREVHTPRVLVLSTDATGTGGIQRATRVLLRSLADLYGGDRVGLLSVWRPEGAVAGRILRYGGPVRVDDSGKVGFIDRASYAMASVFAARRWRRRLVTVAAHPHLAPVALLSRAVSRAPYAVWCHGIEAWGTPRWSVRWALRSADLVIAPSTFTARRVETGSGLPPGSVRVIPHCVSPEALATLNGPIGPSAIETPTVLTAARLTRANRYKGIDTLLYAWPMVRSRVDARLVVLGEGSDRPRLERIARALDLGDSVTFAGWVDDETLQRHYREASLFAMPARHQLDPVPQGEGFGLVFVEAGAAGLPVVAGQGAGTDDAVEHEGSGLLVDADDHRSVVDAIVVLLGNEELAARLGARGRELAATRFSYGVFTDRIGELVRDLGPRGLV